MTVLDTNVISEAMKGCPDARVLRWLNFLSKQSLFATTISEAEIRAGMQAIPEGRRRDQLLLQTDGVFEEDFRGRVLTFDRAAAAVYGSITARRRRLGKPLASLDGQIAAIALAHGAALATRNVRDFDELGLQLINPWS